MHEPPDVLAERSGSERIAGCSGGASGPCRPGSKTVTLLSRMATGLSCGGWLAAQGGDDLISQGAGSAGVTVGGQC
jgi:hypothetical protein